MGLDQQALRCTAELPANMRGTHSSLSGAGDFEGQTLGERITFAGIWFPATAVSIAGTTVTYEADSDTSLPNVIAMYDPLSIHWWLTNGRVGPVWTGMSQNPVYVTLGDPLATNFHTLVRIGCSRAGGLTETTPTAEHIWGAFTGRQVFRADEPTTTLFYYHNGAAEEPFSTARLLETENGNCYSWAEFLLDCWRAQGIATGVGVRVTPLPPASEFLVRDYTFSASGSSTTTVPYDFVFGLDVRDTTGVAGQGFENQNPPSRFICHFIVRFGTSPFYDPSYGTGPFTAQLEWEGASLSGFVRPGVFRGLPVSLVKKEDSGTTGTDFDP